MENQKPPQKTIRTYANDVAEAVKEGQGSMMKIAMSENKRKEEDLVNQTKPKEKKKYIYLGGGFLVVGIIILLLILFLGNKKNNVEPVLLNLNQSILFFDKTNQTDITGLFREDIKKKIASLFVNISPRLNTIEAISLIENTKPETHEVISTEKFFKKIESQAPDQLLRSFNKNISFGIYAFDGNAPFVLLQTDSYDVAFANMLVYERIFFDEWYVTLGFDGQAYRYLFSKNFEDVVIKNQDSRALFDSEGKIILYYTFIGKDKKTLLIGTKESIVIEVVRRISGGTKL